MKKKNLKKKILMRKYKSKRLKKAKTFYLAIFKGLITSKICMTNKIA